jgi:hypothetical protein
MKELTRPSVQRRRFRISNPIGSGAPAHSRGGLAQYIRRRGVLVARTLHGPVVDERETLGVALSSLLPMRHITPSPARPSYSLWLRVAPIDLSQCDQLPDLGLSEEFTIAWCAARSKRRVWSQPLAVRA